MKQLFLISTFTVVFMIVNKSDIFSQQFAVIYHDRPELINANFANSVASAEPGFQAVQITTGELNKFRQVAPPNIRTLVEKLNDGNHALTKSLVEVARISGPRVGTIFINLINDANGLPPLPQGKKGFFCRDNTDNGKVLAGPCGSNAGDKGFILLGEQAAGSPFIEFAMVHEMFHTQTIQVKNSPATRYGKKFSVRIIYGGEESHFDTELLGDQQAAMEEGIGNYLGSVHLPDMKDIAKETLLNNKPFFLGSRSVLSGVGEMWNAAHSVFIDTVIRQVPADGAPVLFTRDGFRIKLLDSPVVPGQRYIARMYHYCDVPGKFIFHAELMPELYLHMFEDWAYSRPQDARKSIFKFLQYYAQPTPFGKHHYPATMAMFFAADMESFNRRQHGPNFTPVSSIFALALYDLLTRFNISDNDLKRDFNIATFSMPGLSQIPSSKAFQKYFSVRGMLKEKLLKAMLDDEDCRGTEVSFETAVKNLRLLCDMDYLVNLVR